MTGRGRGRKGNGQKGRGAGPGEGSSQTPLTKPFQKLTLEQVSKTDDQFVEAPMPTTSAWGPPLGGSKSVTSSPSVGSSSQPISQGATPTPSAWGPSASPSPSTSSYTTPAWGPSASPSPSASSTKTPAWGPSASPSPSTSSTKTPAWGPNTVTPASNPKRIGPPTPVNPQEGNVGGQQTEAFAWGQQPRERQPHQQQPRRPDPHRQDPRDHAYNRGQSDQPSRPQGSSEVFHTVRDRKDMASRGRGGRSDGGEESKRRVITDIVKTKPDHVQSKRGSSGTTVPLLTNYFKLIKSPTWQLYQYRVDFAPETEIAGLKNSLIYEQRETFKGYLFDGTTLLIRVHLTKDITEFMSKDREGNPIRMTVKYTGQVSMSTAQSIQVLNLIQRKSMKGLDLKLVGRNYFDDSAPIELPQYRLQLWPGYVTSIRQHEVDVLLCAEVTHKVMRRETVLSILRDCQRKHKHDFVNVFNELVVGTTVLTDYNNKTYQIHDVDFERTPLTMFEGKDKKMISFVDYYRTKYAAVITDTRQPLLISKSKDRALRAGEERLVALIPELCRPTGLTEEMRKDNQLMRGLANYTRVNPADRINKLRQFNHRLYHCVQSSENFKQWDFELDQNLVAVTGRCLRNENIILGNNRQVPTNEKADWSQLFRNNAMFNSQALKQWAIIYCDRSATEVNTFLGVLQNVARTMNYQMSDPKRIPIANDNTGYYGKALDDAANFNPQLIMCIVSNQTADRYSLIKKKCCVYRAIPTQVMCLRTIRPKPGQNANALMTVATKVVIQMNSKLGGAPWMVGIPLSGLMVIGFDVCHDTSNNRKSYGAMVATMDMRLKQNYFSAVSEHESNVDLSKNFAFNIRLAVLAYHKAHKKLPEKILIYRDGVGEGQTDYVRETEIKQIQAALKEIYKTTETKFTFIVVSKRINTRFFRSGQNPSPGTVVDDVVTLPERYDFFIVSQNVNQGTVTTTNYNVLHDGIKMKTDELQMLTYKMTHLYYNWTGTLRVPAVCQYAHKLAFLVGNFIHTAPSNMLEKQLYFL